MIAIVNLGPAPGNKHRDGTAKNPLGPHLYQVKINAVPKAVFTHTRQESLTTCLRLAAAACEAEHDKQMLHLLTASTEPALPESVQ